jgi:hypothetical protein
MQKGAFAYARVDPPLRRAVAASTSGTLVSGRTSASAMTWGAVTPDVLVVLPSMLTEIRA